MGSVQNKKQADEYSRRRHHRGSGFCGFDYRAAVALANAPNYLKPTMRRRKNGVAFLYSKGDTYMKKTTFNISFDEDKASVLVLYLSQKGATIETELEKAFISGCR